MSDELDKLKNAMAAAEPDVDDNAQARAIDAGMAAFEKKFQGSADAARPTREQTQWWALILRGIKDMFRTFTTREAMMASVSVAALAMAVVITGQFKPTTFDDEVTMMMDTSVSVAPLAEPMIAAPSAVAKIGSDAAMLSAAMPMMETSVGVSGIVAAAPPPTILRSREAPVGADDMMLREEMYILPAESTEQFPDVNMNPLKVVSEEPVSTFSVDVDTASYAYMRSSILGGALPTKDAVRTEELINYFSYDYPVPQRGDAPFTTSVTVMDTPWNEGTKLLHIGIKGYELPIEDRPPVNLVFLIDTSGSMQDADKLPLLVNSFRLMLSNLQPDDKVAIVTYAGSAGVVLEPTAANDSAKILASLENLFAGGSTAGQAGLEQAYTLAEQMGANTDATSRVILATDGDFNVGISEPEALKEYVEDRRESGVYLSVLGFGRGNYNDALMQSLAQNGNGTAAYIDTLAEAQKVLVDQIGGALFTIAQDVKIQVEFNPAEVAEYRLLGYETRGLNREDFNNDTVDAGEIGAGHTVTAIYEITPVGSDAVMVDELRYATDEPGSLNKGEYAFLKLRYKNPGENTSQLISTPITPDANANMESETNFASAVAGFGQLLRGDSLMKNWTIDDARNLAEGNKGSDPYGYRAELLTLMRLAESLD